MNDRLDFKLALPEHQTTAAMDGCLAVMAYFLETSSQYMELHTEAFRSQMEHLFRSDILRVVAPQQTQSLNEYYARLDQQARQAGEFLQQSLDLSMDYHEKLKVAFTTSAGRLQEFATTMQEAAKPLDASGKVRAGKEIVDASMENFSKAAKKLSGKRR